MRLLKVELSGFASRLYRVLSSVVGHDRRPRGMSSERAVFTHVRRHLIHLCGVLRRDGQGMRTRERRLRSLISSVSRRIEAPIDGVGVVMSALLAGSLRRRRRGRFLGDMEKRVGGLSFLVRTLIGASHLRAKIVRLRGRSRFVCSALTRTVDKVMCSTRRGGVRMSIRYPRSIHISRSDG